MEPDPRLQSSRESEPTRILNRTSRGIAIFAFTIGPALLLYGILADLQAYLAMGCAVIIYAGMVLIARADLRRGRPDRAVSWLTKGGLSVVLLVALIPDAVTPGLHIAVITIVGLALPVLDDDDLMSLTLLAGGTQGVIAAMALPHVPVPGPRTAMALGINFASTVGLSILSLYLLWQFRAHLRSNLALAERTNAELKEVDALKTRFINSVAHELGTPLTAIRLQMHLLKRTHASGTMERREKSLRVVDRNFNRLELLVHDLVDTARMERGRIQLTLQPTDATALLHECRDTFEEVARAKGIKLSVDAAPGIMLDADGARLQQVLVNLVSNAMKFTPNGGRVDLTLSSDGPHTVLTVKDSGAGIAADDLPRVFDAFIQGTPTDGVDRGGTGLGLHISRTIVEAHGGVIGCDSEGAGHGTTFTASFPTNGGSMGRALPAATLVGAGTAPGAAGGSSARVGT